MKLIIVGKGGSGKSTITALLAMGLVERGKKVIVVDADESNTGLHRLLGVEEPQELMENFGGKKAVGKKMWDAMGKGEKANLFEDPWTMQDIPPGFVARHDGIALVQTGKVKHFGEGCACAMGALSREFLENLILRPDEVCIVDTEAGVEHLGRGVAKGCDLILMVLDPSMDSLKLADKVVSMANEAQKPVEFVLNRADRRLTAEVVSRIHGGEMVAMIPPQDEILFSGLEGGRPPTDVKGVDILTDHLLRKMGECT